MNFPSYIAGPFFMALGFLLCSVLVVGTKSVLIFIKDKIKQKFSRDKGETPPITQKLSVRKKPKKQDAKSISLNTEDIDRIYFRKSS